MPVYVITGKLGDGKSLCAVSRAVEYLIEGRRVVSNFPVDVSSLSCSPSDSLASAVVEVVPARPTSRDLCLLGSGGPDERKAGLLILDECAVFLNSRTWSGNDRQEVINWLLHSRKLCWDVFLIVQHYGALDKQIREMVAQYHVVCRRLDRLNVPFVSWVVPVRMPRVHLAVVRYGFDVSAIAAETWTFRAKPYYACYSTQWVSEVDSYGWHSVLPARLSRWRYEPRKKTVGQHVGELLGLRSLSRVNGRPVARLAPLMCLPVAVRWTAARRLVERGYL